MSYKITEEGKNRVKMNSPFSLPTSPSERGMKAEAIKEMFWKPFAELIELINVSIGGLEVEDGVTKSLIDEKISKAKEDIEEAILNVEKIAKGANQAKSFEDYTHVVNTLNAAGKDDYSVGQNLYVIQKDVPDLWISRTESKENQYILENQYNFIEEIAKNGYAHIGWYDVALLETQKVDLTEYITEEKLIEFSNYNNDYIDSTFKKLNAEIIGFVAEQFENHSNDEESHKDIRDLAQVAFNAAVGKRTVWYEATMQAALGAIAFNQSIAKGNAMIIGVKGVPDLIVFPNEDDALKNASIITIEEIENEEFPEITAGSFFKIFGGINNFGFAAIESGIDTSAIATREYVDSLVGDVNGVLDLLHDYAEALKAGDA